MQFLLTLLTAPMPFWEWLMMLVGASLWGYSSITAQRQRRYWQRQAAHWERYAQHQRRRYDELCIMAMGTATGEAEDKEVDHAPSA